MIFKLGEGMFKDIKSVYALEKAGYVTKGKICKLVKYYLTGGNFTEDRQHMSIISKLLDSVQTSACTYYFNNNEFTAYIQDVREGNSDYTNLRYEKKCTALTLRGYVPEVPLRLNLQNVFNHLSLPPLKAKIHPEKLWNFLIAYVKNEVVSNGKTATRYFLLDDVKNAIHELNSMCENHCKV